MNEYSFNNDKKDTEIEIDIDKIIGSLNEPVKQNMEHFTKNLELELKNYTTPYHNIHKNKDSEEYKINNNLFYNYFNNYKDIIIYTIIFILLNINKIPIICNIDNFSLNLILRTIIFIIILYIIKKYKIM